MNSGQGLSSTTAPGKIFSSRGELADHYKSDWHKYNLKRREASMAMLTFPEFSARLEAAMALRREREGREERSGNDHLKDKNSAKAKSNGAGSQRKLSKRQLRQQERNGGVVPPSSTLSNKSSQVQDPLSKDDRMEGDAEEESNDGVTHTEDEAGEEPPEINPKQSLFDKHISESVQANVDYMYKKYGFFIPDIEYLVDMEGLIGYCAEKIKLGHTCLYSQKMFKTWRGCQQSMINKRHTKLRYEAGIDLEEFDVFYDFTLADEDFLKAGLGNHKGKKKTSAKKQVLGDGDENLEAVPESMDVDVDDDDSGEWEDIDSDDEEMNDDEDGLFAAYQDEIAQHGFDITPLGELVFPDGRIVGHRGLSRYYKQRITPEDSRTAVIAARRANGERLFKGRVYDTYELSPPTEDSLALRKAGLSVDAVKGRKGHGILVPTGGPGGSRTSYTALSLYRYKAAVKKSRREEFKGRRLQQRTTLPINKMDKKANRLFNNVSVAHAPR